MTTEQEKAIYDNAYKQLVRIADMMEGADGALLKELKREYRAYAKIVMPEQFKRKSKSKTN